MRINPNGNVGINESSPLAKFHVRVADSGTSAYAHCAAVFEDSDHTFIDIMSGTTGSGGINFGDSGGSQRGVVEYDHNSDFMRLIVAGGERMRIDSSGKFLLGTTTVRSPGGVSTTLQVEGTNAASSSLSLTRNQNNTEDPVLCFAKTRGNSTGTTTIVQDDDKLGDIIFAGADGTDIESKAARIQAFVDGTPGSNDMPGRLTFSTTADGAASTTERMRIDSSGRVMIGGSTYIGGAALTVLGTGDTPNSYGCFAIAKVGADPTADTTLVNIRLNGG